MRKCGMNMDDPFLKAFGYGRSNTEKVHLSHYKCSTPNMLQTQLVTPNGILCPSLSLVGQREREREREREEEEANPADMQEFPASHCRQ